MAVKMYFFFKHYSGSWKPKRVIDKRVRIGCRSDFECNTIHTRTSGYCVSGHLTYYHIYTIYTCIYNILYAVHDTVSEVPRRWGGGGGSMNWWRLDRRRASNTRNDVGTYRVGIYISCIIIRINSFESI